MSNILIVDDDVQINQLIDQTLSVLERHIHHAYTLAQANRLIRAEIFDLLLLDLSLPDGNALNALPEIMDSHDSPEVVIITGARDKNGASYALEAGVFDYLQKPLDLKAVLLSCKRALEFKALRSQRSQIKLLNRENIIGKHPKLNQCLEETAKAATVDSSTLVTGETGTGKELIARAIHDNSRRAGNNFIIVDCAALKDTLMESMLFGHEKGAFTGAEARQEGRVAMAHKGTLFLDEIGELDMEAQKRFLRFLNDKSFYPLGSKSLVTSDFRLVAATNRELEKEVEENRFRADLFYRLSGRMIHVPALRRRKEDIRELAFHYVELICRRMQLKPKKIYPEFLEALTQYDWPGNVRELINMLDSAIANFPDDPVLHPRSLPAKLRVALFDEKAQPEEPNGCLPDSTGGFSFQGELPYWKSLRQQMLNNLEKAYFEELLARANGKAKEMARLSGLSQPSIYELFKKYRPKF